MHKGIIAATTTVGAFCLTLGLSYPLLALVLESRGVATDLNGLNAAMTPLGLILSSPFIPRWAARWGAWRLAMVGLLLNSAVLLLLAITPYFWVWFPLRFCLGVVINVVFVISETWINQLASSQRRGRTMGFYVTIASTGFALGPLSLSWVGSQGWPPFLIGITGPLIALVILAKFRGHLPQFISHQNVSVWSFLYLAPLLLLAVTAAALFDQASLAFLPIYGIRHGMSESAAALALGVLAAGNIFCQIPIGWAADRISRQILLILLVIGSVGGCLVLPWLIGAGYLLWPMLFIWGALAFGSYTVALAELGDKFSGAQLIAGSGAFAMMWGVGGSMGSPLAGLAMEWMGPNGLPLTIGVTYSLLGIAVCLMPLSRPENVGVTES